MKADLPCPKQLRISVPVLLSVPVPGLLYRPGVCIVHIERRMHEFID